MDIFKIHAKVTGEEGTKHGVVPSVFPFGTVEISVSAEESLLLNSLPSSVLRSSLSSGMSDSSMRSSKAVSSCKWRLREAIVFWHSASFPAAISKSFS